MVDFFVEFCIWLWSFLDMMAKVGGLFALIGLFWLLLTREGRHFLEWFGDNFLE